MKELTIGEVARRAGIKTSAVRFYEKRGLIAASRRVNKQRRYDPAVMQKLGMIHFAQQAGYTIAEINTLLHGFEATTPASERWKTLGNQKLDEMNALIELAQTRKHLLEKTLHCQCVRLDDCMASCLPQA